MQQLLPILKGPGYCRSGGEILSTVLCVCSSVARAWPGWHFSSHTFTPHLYSLPTPVLAFAPCRRMPSRSSSPSAARSSSTAATRRPPATGCSWRSPSCTRPRRAAARQPRQKRSFAGSWRMQRPGSRWRVWSWRSCLGGWLARRRLQLQLRSRRQANPRSLSGCSG